MAADVGNSRAQKTTAELISAAHRSLPPDDSPWRKASRFLATLEDEEAAAYGEFAFHSWPPQPSDLAAVRHCFDCSSYFPEVFRSCAPVSANGAVNTSTALACQTRCRKASSVTHAGLLHLSSQGLKQTQRYQRASFQRRIHQRAAVRLPPATASARFPFYFCSPGSGGNLPLIVSHFPLSDFKPGQRMDG